jgi:membrane protease YdiL (CAAX protease family)
MTRPAVRSSPRLLADVSWFYVLAMLGAGGLGVVQTWTPLDRNMLTLNQFGPLCAVVVVMAVGGGRLRRRWWPLQVITMRDGVAVLAMIAVAVVLFGSIVAWYEIRGWDVHATGLAGLPVALPILVVAQILGAAGEEVGWRGFLQHRLQSRFSVLVSAVIVGLMWGIWHPYVFGEGPSFAGGFLIWTIAMSVIIAVVCDTWRFNRIACGASLHCAVNIGLMMILNEENGSVRAMTTTSIVTALVAVITVGLSRVGTHTKTQTP